MHTGFICVVNVFLISQFNKNEVRTVKGLIKLRKVSKSLLWHVYGCDVMQEDRLSRVEFSSELTWFAELVITHAIVHFIPSSLGHWTEDS